jgi:hypothetical protein
MRIRLAPSLAALALAAAGLGACDKATPVAPGGSVLSISANPSRISLQGSSTITVTGRKPDGNPLHRGTEIRLSASLGTIAAVVTVDDAGTATAQLRGDGRAGEAAVTATTGDGSVTASVNVLVGETGGTKPVLVLSVNPNNIPVLGSATVTIIARNADGSPASGGQTVLLTTTLGTLDPARPWLGPDHRHHGRERRRELRRHDPRRGDGDQSAGQPSRRAAQRDGDADHPLGLRGQRPRGAAQRRPSDVPGRARHHVTATTPSEDPDDPLLESTVVVRVIG